MAALNATSALSANVRGMLWMLVGAFSFTVMSALMKQLSGTLPITVVVFFRMFFAVLFFLPWIVRTRFAGLRTRRMGLHLLRSLLGALAMVSFVYALSRLILADTIALAHTTPLWMIIIAIPLLGEVAGVRRALATGLGFFGVLAIVRPHLEFEPASLVALACAFFTSLAMIAVKKLSTTDPPMTIAFYFNFFGSLYAAVPAAMTWQLPSALDWVILLGTGLTGMIGHVCSTRAYAIGQATVVAPADFSRMPLAVLLGFVFFSELPDAWSVAGIVMIILAMFYISRPEGAGRSRVERGGTGA